MNKENKRKKVQWQKHIWSIFLLLIGAIFGFFMGKYMDFFSTDTDSSKTKLISLVLMLVLLWIAFFINIIIHEAGHMVFGLMSGYKFSSFRIMSFMWIKENGKLKIKRLSLAGTGGQCIMIPPEMKNGKFPVVLYNMGGSLMNIISGFIFLALHFIFIDVWVFNTILLMLALVGFMTAAMNGIPMRTDTIDNDGYNTIALCKNRKSLKAFWVQMKVSEQTSKGIRLKDMPKEWFTVPTDEEMQNSIVSVIGVFTCNRLMDENRFEDADKLMEHLLSIESGMVGIHRNLLVCDRIYCELIGQNRRDVVENMLTKQQKSFMNAMKKFPSVLRTEYAYALLSEKDTAKAGKIKAQFEKTAKSYPYASDIDSERELIEIADNK